jgi:hypothetical protein
MIFSAGLKMLVAGIVNPALQARAAALEEPAGR